MKKLDSPQRSRDNMSAVSLSPLGASNIIVFFNALFNKNILCSSLFQKDSVRQTAKLLAGDGTVNQSTNKYSA